MSDTTYMPATDNADNAGAGETQQRPVRIVHLVFGVLFLGIVAIWALGASGTLEFDVRLALLWPLVLILAGVAGLAAMVANAARNRRTKGSSPYES